jgi:hypothetical protein
MVVDNKFVRWNVKTDHPRERCEATVKSGQCPYKKARSTNHCEMHGANSGENARKTEIQRNYRLQRWQNRISEFADNDNIKSLREEVGILRMVLEEMLNQCETSLDILLYSQKMSDLVMKIERLVTSCDKLENRMGLLLNKSSVLQLASTYVQIINNYVSDPDIIESISQEMAQATLAIENPLED